MSRWSTAAIYARMLWWLYLWASAIFIIIAWFRHDAQFFGVDFTGFFVFYAIACLIYLLCAEIVPPFWWLVTFPWRLRFRPLAAVSVVAVVALWLALLLAVLPHYHRLVARRRRSQWPSRGLLSAGGALLIGVLVLTGCSAQGMPTMRTPVPTVTPLPMITAVPTCTPETGPCPVSGLLDSPPQHCPASPSLDTLSFSHFGGFVGGVQFVGHAPVWIPRPYLGGSTVPITIHAEQNGYTPFPGNKIIWEVGPNYTQPVSVQLIDLRTGALAWWSLDATHSARTFVLDPAVPQGDTYHRSPEPGWHEWGSGVTIAEAGCYSLQVTWPGGNWRVIVAAGR